MFNVNQKILGFLLSSFLFSVALRADKGNDVQYQVGDEFAKLTAVAMGGVNTNQVVVPDASVLNNRRVLIFDPGSNSFEQRAVVEFMVPDLNAKLEGRLIETVTLKLTVASKGSTQKDSPEIWAYRDTANGRVDTDDYAAGEKLGQAVVNANELSSDVTDFVTAGGAGYLGFRIQLADGSSGSGERKLTFSNATLQFKLAKQVFTMRGQKPSPPPLTLMDDAAQWSVKMIKGADKSAVSMATSREVTFFGQPVSKISYSGAGVNAEIHLVPLKPLLIPNRFDAADLWSWGNSFNYDIQRTIFLILMDNEGKETCRPLSHKINQSGPMEHFVNFPQPWAKFDLGKRYFLKAIVVKNFTAVPQDWFYLGPVSFYERNAKAEAPESGNRLKLPVDSKSMTPPSNANGQVVGINGKKFVFTAATPGDQVEYVYQPAKGTMDDITVIHKGKTFKPMTEGGIMSAASGLVTGKLKSLVLDDQHKTLRTEWTAMPDGGKYSITLSLINQSLVLEIAAEGDRYGGFSFGGLTGMANAKLVEVPYLCSWGKTNGVLGMRVVNRPGTFFLGFIDHYFSNANDLYAKASIDEDGQIFYNGGSQYFADTKNQRHPLQERIVLTASTELDGVLPAIPNPVLFDQQKAKGYYFAGLSWPNVNTLKLLHDSGMNDLFIWVFWWNAANTAWNAMHPELRGQDQDGYDWSLPKDGRPCPKVWRDITPQDFMKMIRGFGWKFGLYTYYNDISPVATSFSRDWLALGDDNQPQMGCLGYYWVKPPFMPAFQQRLAESIKKEWGAIDGTYLDVATIRCPWGAGTDMDGAAANSGQLSTYFRSVAQLLAQEIQDFGQTWSEGQFTWLYAGLCTGSYGTLLTADPRGAAGVPMLPEFDLRRIHPKSQLIGMAPAVHMFIGKPMPTGEFRNDQVCQYFAALLGYGHLSQYQDWDSYYLGSFGVAKGYYLFKEMQTLYAFAPIKTIEYFNGKDFVSTSQAIEDNSYLQGRIREVYENGLTVYVNYHATETWTIKVDGQELLLPTWGFYAFHQPTDLLVYSIEQEGGRRDYSRSAKYVYADSWGRPAEFTDLRINGAGAVKIINDREIHFIPLGTGDGSRAGSPGDFGVKEAQFKLSGFFPSLRNGAPIPASLKVKATNLDGKETEFKHKINDGWLTITPSGHNRLYVIER